MKIHLFLHQSPPLSILLSDKPGTSAELLLLSFVVSPYEVVVM